MSKPSSKATPTSLWLPFALVILALALRVAKSTEIGADLLPNFSPWMALAFAGTALFPRRLAWWACPAALILVDIVVQHEMLASYPITMLIVYACYALAALAGKSFRREGVSGWSILGGTVVCSLGFYAVMNTVSWAMEPAYAKTLIGWWQSQTVGLPGFPPSWVFLRNALLADVGFASLLVASCQVESVSRQVPALRWGQGTSTVA